MMQPQPKTRRRLYLMILPVIAVIVGAWAYSHSRLAIKVMNPGSGNLSITLVSLKNGDTKFISTPGPVITKTLKKGEYEVNVSQNDKNYLSYVKLGGFLSKKGLDVSLSTESGRSFVGSNPDSCMFYTDKLFSYSCGGSFSSITQHVPATSTTPSYASRLNSSGIEGIIEGLIKTSVGNIALVHLVDADGAEPHIVYLLDNNLKPVSQKILSGLNVSTNYSIAPYLNGFVAYDSSLSKIYYYTSIDTAPRTIAVPESTGASLKPAALSSSGDTLTILFTNNPTTDDSNTPAVKKVKNELLIISESGQNTLEKNDMSIAKASQCGKGYLCVLISKSVFVYSQNNLRSPTMKIRDVDAMYPTAGGAVLIRKNDVLSVDPSTSTLKIDYSYGPYKNCGSQYLETGKYILCITGLGLKQGLFIDEATNNIDSIDKKVFKLSQDPKIDAVSAYGKYIFVTPKLGALVYSPTLNIYDYEPSAKAAADVYIGQATAKIGIDKSVYSIINTAD